MAVERMGVRSATIRWYCVETWSHLRKAWIEADADSLILYSAQPLRLIGAGGISWQQLQVPFLHGTCLRVGELKDR